MGNIFLCSNLIIPNIYDFNNSFGWNKDDIQQNQDVYNFVPEQLILTKNFILNKININSEGPKKIFIYRETKLRQSGLMTNLKFINDFKNLGFKFISLDNNIDFIKQVNLFHNAEIVISEAGSCCANIMFMKKNSNYFLISPDSEFIDKTFFKNYADIFNVKLYNILTEAKIFK